jgi:hypothetical protein
MPPVGKLHDLRDKVRELRDLPGDFRDITQAQQASTPHLEAANLAQEKIVALLKEVESEHSGLTEDEKAARRREIDELWEEVRREKEAARLPMDDLKARHPGKIS